MAIPSQPLILFCIFFNSLSLSRLFSPFPNQHIRPPRSSQWSCSPRRRCRHAAAQPSTPLMQHALGLLQGSDGCEDSLRMVDYCPSVRRAAQSRHVCKSGRLLRRWYEHRTAMLLVARGTAARTRRWSYKGCSVMPLGKGGVGARRRAVRIRVPCFHLLPWRGGLATMTRRRCYHGASALLFYKEHFIILIVIKLTLGICITRMHIAQIQVSSQNKKGNITYHSEQL
jgi:hypothetical protein